MLEIKNISKHYKTSIKTYEVIKDISLTVDRQDIAVIIGASGSGKTTLLNLMSGFLSETQGEVCYLSKPLSLFSEKEKSVFRNKEMGFVYQNFLCEQSLNVYENVALPLIVAGCPKKEIFTRVKVALTEVGLLDKAKIKAKKLSGGELQRMCIARALINHPKILFADEPTGSLDEKNGQAVIDLILRANKNGTTVVLVTHNSEYLKYATKVFHIVDGMLQK